MANVEFTDTSQSHRTDLVSSDKVYIEDVSVEAVFNSRNPTVLIWSVPTIGFGWERNRGTVQKVAIPPY
jgi:hypothetical protein